MPLNMFARSEIEPATPKLKVKHVDHCTTKAAYIVIEEKIKNKGYINKSQFSLGLYFHTLARRSSCHLRMKNSLH